MVLTKDEVEKVINKKDNSLKLVDYSINPIDAQGMMGKYFSLTCNVKDVTSGSCAQEEFFVKGIGDADLDKQFKATLSNKEGSSYKLFNKMDFDLIKEVTPICYLVTDNGTLVLEQLKNANYKGIDDIMKHIQVSDEGDYWNCIETMLHSLAGLHASSVIYEEQMSRTLGRKYTLYEDYKDAMVEIYFNKDFDINRKQMEATINGLAREAQLYNVEFVGDVGKLFQSIFDLVGPSKTYRNVLSHADVCFPNILGQLQQEGSTTTRTTLTNCKFVDFQVVRYAPPTRDLMALIYLNTTREFRRENYEKMLSKYYDSFSSHLARYDINVDDVMSRQEFDQSCKEDRIFGVCGACIWLPTALLSVEDLKVTLQDEYFARIYLADRGVMFDLITRNEDYDKKLKDTLIDINEYFLLYIKNYCN